MQIERRALLRGSLALALVGFVARPAAGDEISKILAPSGKLKAGLYAGTPTSILPAAKGQEARGLGFEIGRELAKRLGVPYEPVIFSKNVEVLEAVKTGAVDVAFTNASPARAKEMDFGVPYLEIELGYLASKGSPVTSLDRVDEDGRRVGVTTGSSSDGVMSSSLKKSKLVRIDTFPQVVDMLNTGQIDVFATNKATLYELAEKAPGSVLIEGRWGLERHAIAIPKGRDSALPFIERFTRELRQSGFVRDSAERAGLKGALTN
jgi:polar amino acid transport system substrate-binding protein